MNVFTFIRQKVLDSLNQLVQQGVLPEGLDFSRVTVDSPKESSHGDISTNAAMVLSKSAGMNPRTLATAIVEKLSAIPEILQVDIAGPGFVNMKLDPDLWRQQLLTILKEGIHYGDSQIGAGTRVNVEYVSINPTGPMHTGHGRNAVLGDTVASLLQKIGYDVTREYYINDAGGQTIALARSAYLRYLEALGMPVSPEDFAGDMYPGDYLIPVGQALAAEHGAKWVNQPESEWLEIVRLYTIDAMMDMIRNDLELLGVEMDIYTSERAVVQKNRVEEALKILEEQGDIYVGVLEKPKGHDADDWEARPQTLFRSTKYGDDVDRPLKKSDGSWTYFAGDIAYHLDKFQRGFTQMVDVLGADHAGYFKRIKSAVTAVTKGQAEVEIKVCQMVNFLENAVPVRMSKRAGTFITLRDVIERVGKDVTRFMMLIRRQDMPIDFDFVKVTEQSRDNPVFYVQYAHARACSVLRHVKTIFPEVENFSEIKISLLTDDAELGMIKLLASWPQQVEVAALAREPHRIANYLYDVASLFHALWNKGKEHVHLRFIDPENKDLTMARMGLVQSVATVIASGLVLFGITPVEEMR
jgi:arginyl-tRNA synthetase